MTPFMVMYIIAALFVGIFMLQYHYRAWKSLPLTTSEKAVSVMTAVIVTFCPIINLFACVFICYSIIMGRT